MNYVWRACNLKALIDGDCASFARKVLFIVEGGQKLFHILKVKKCFFYMKRKQIFVEFCDENRQHLL